MSNIYRRNEKKGDMVWYARFRGPDPDRPGRNKPYLRCTFTTDEATARARLKAMVAAAQAERFDVLDLAKARRPVLCTMEQLFALYRQGARYIKPATVKNNINALKNLIRRALGSQTNVEKVSIMDLTPDLMWKWKEAIADSIQAEGVDEHRAQQLARTANSILRMAKGLFTRDMLVYYERQGKLKIPDPLRQFITEPPLKNAGKVDYSPPDDATLAKTFESLETFRDVDRNLYLAVWLAVGFGLRKSEIAKAKVGCIIQRAGIVYFLGSALAKNGTVPDVSVQQGAWQKIQPFLVGRNPDEYILTGTDTARNEETFRRVSSWMRHLGWNTQKTIHEFRAYSGCKIAEVHGMTAARQWLRHASTLTTEKHYGRYIRMRIGEVPMNLPAPPAPFIPHVVSGDAH